MGIFVDKDYYKILDIDKTASLDTIIKAYYKQMFEKKDISYLEKEKIREAYNVLSDSKKKKEYDEFLVAPQINYDLLQIHPEADEELALIQQYDRILNETINRLLKQKHNISSLEVAILRYENQIKLIKKIIEFKESQNLVGDRISRISKEIAKLNYQLHQAEENLQKIKQSLGDEPLKQGSNSTKVQIK